ncbi:MAG: TrkH family potassium uptake protein [Bacillota bacterium]
MKNQVIKLNPSQLLLFLFLGFIVLGTILLKIPAASTEPISWLDALFTATSAMTVTGLVVVDTGTAYNLFGELVIVGLIQVGGLGIMSFAVLIYIMLGKKIGMKERLLIQQALNQTSLGGVINLVRYLFVFSFLIEFIAMIFLSFRWVPEFGWSKGIYFSFFHSISAFNNAGFGLLPDSLMQYVGDPIINIVISFLFIIGGIGFTVLMDLKQKKRFKKLSLHTKLMLIGSFVINIIAMLFIFFVEYSNPKTLGGLDWAGKLWGSYFQAVVPRTAGFNSLDIASLNEPTILFIIFLMFIGAGSASTGGGIKLTTFLVIIFSVINYIKAKDEIVISNRSISQTSILKSLAIATTSIVFILLCLIILTLTEQKPFLMILFEVVSAFGTVGLSMGITGTLTSIGKCIIILVMFFGKLGPLTLAYTLAKPDKAKIKYPKEDILTG